MTSMLNFYGGFLIKMEKYDLAIIGAGPIGPVSYTHLTLPTNREV